MARIPPGRRAHQLRPQPCGRVSSNRRLHREDPQRRQARRPAGHAADDLRAGDQPQNRQGAGPQRTAASRATRRRGDRMKRRAPQVRSSPRKRGPRATERGLWIPSISASTRVYDALCAGMNGMERRAFITLLAAAAAWPLAARAQQAGKTYRLGLLAIGPAAVVPLDERRKTLLSGLAARGFVEGQNLALVQRSADAHPERLDGLAAELAAAHVDVLVTFSYPAALAAKKATKDVPIVVVGAGDPVATGLVDGLARPGGNITGVTERSTE